MRIVRSDNLRDNEGIQGHWKQIISLAANDAERKTIIQILGSLRKQWAVGLLTQIKNDAINQDVKTRADDAIKNVNKLLAEKES